jgi:hypothetical protein
MYYMDGDNKIDDNICIRSGPPFWYFEQFRVSLRLIKTILSFKDTFYLTKKSFLF